jgi:hypothetical protein
MWGMVVVSYQAKGEGNAIKIKGAFLYGGETLFLSLS